MKIILLTFSAFLFSAKLAFSCACVSDKSYATLFKHYKNAGTDFVAGKGVVLHKSQDFVKLKVIESYFSGSGLPSDSVINVRNAMRKSSFPCANDPATVYYASNFLSDTVVFLVPKIIEKFYSWDVIGEYRIRPDTLSNITEPICNGQFELRAKKDTIFRRVVEVSGVPFNYPDLKYTNYTFKQYIGIINGLSPSDVESNTFSLFPNPSDNLLNITLNKPCSGCKVEILDSYSKSVLQKPYDDASLDISNLKSGLYYFLLKDNNRTVGSSKFVKM